MAMKRSVIGIVVVAALIVGVAAVVWADTRGWAGHGGWHGWHGGGPLGFVARELDLNDAQRKQIGTLWRAERPQIGALVGELAAESAEMRAAHAAGVNGNVEGIASLQGVTLAKLIAEKEKLRAEIYAQVLTAAQRAKADEMEKRFQSRLDEVAKRLSDTNDEEVR